MDFDWRFIGDYNPLSLDMITMKAGFTPSAKKAEFTYLDLKCGDGVSCNIYASCYPESQIHGINFDSGNIENAINTAKKSDIHNVTFHECAYDELITRNIPKFDYIILDGIYHLLSTTEKKSIHEIIQKTLKPGGLFYCRYNTLPGAAQQNIVWDQISQYVEKIPGNPQDKSEQALKYLAFLIDNNAPFFQMNPVAAANLRDMIQTQKNIMIQEWLMSQSTPLYFKDVYRDMAGIGLDFIGSQPFHMNLKEISDPLPFGDLLNSAPDRLTYETHKSFILNEAVRRDIYRRPNPQEENAPDWRAVIFGCKTFSQNIKMSSAFPAGQIAFNGPIYYVLTRLLGDTTLSYGTLCEHPDLAPYDSKKVLEALHILCATQQFTSFNHHSKITPSLQEPLRLTLALNRLMLEENLFVDSTILLASPILGEGVRVDLVISLFLLALDKDDSPPEIGRLAQIVWQKLIDTDQQISFDGHSLQGQGETLAVLRSRAKEFLENIVPQFISWSILAPASE